MNASQHPYRAAAIQLNSTPDLDHNLEQAAEWISRAVERGATVVGLPENFSFLGPEAERLERAEEISRRSETFLVDRAAQHQIVLLGGGHAAPAPRGKTFNRSILVGPEGTVARYDKIHLFDVDLPGQVLRESDTVLPGKSVVVADGGPAGRHGLSICYDLRFPELYRQLSRDGADVLWVPAAFTAYTGPAHWETLLRARAIENACFVIAPAQCGHHFGDRRSHGHAMVVDPWGVVLSDAGTEPGFAMAEIDPTRITEARQRIPSFRHRVL